MTRWMRLAMLVVALAAQVVACGTPAPAYPGQSTDDPVSRSVGAAKRVTVGVSREPQLQPDVNTGRGWMRLLVNPGLNVLDDHRTRLPALAEQVPSLENGLWRLLPDGHMETIWTIRSGARWHDGAPVTADDLLFTLQMGRAVPGLGNLAYNSIDHAVVSGSRADGSAATDAAARTLTVFWNEPFINADQLFGAAALANPLPRHRLEDASHRDPAAFLQLPFWTQDYVGAGPFRVREWLPGARVTLEAVPDYVLGRPRIDEIEVRTIENGNTMLANLLAGGVDVARELESVDLGVQIRQQWADGVVTFSLDSSGMWLALYPQFVNPRPTVVADVRFRRALLYGVDRQNIVDTIAAGTSPVAHSATRPNQPEYRDIEARIPRYAYDPRNTAQLLEELGYHKDSDNSYRDSSGARLEIELRSVAVDRAIQATQAIADGWRQLGIDTITVEQTPPGRQSAEEGATFPSFLVAGLGIGSPISFHSSRAPLPENNFRVTAPPNVSRYQNPQLDGLIDAYFRTVPLVDRTQILGEILYHVADQVVAAGLYYNANPTAVANRVVNVTLPVGWNGQEWDLRG